MNKRELKTKKYRALRVRKKIHGTAERPRLCVVRSAKHIYAQLIDDDAGRTLLAISSLSNESKGKPVEIATAVGKELGEKASGMSITSIIVDRGMRRYHGRLKALAEGAREAGLKF